MITFRLQIKEIPGYPRYYAGVDGNIYSAKSSRWRKLGYGLNKDGYRQVKLRVNGLTKTRLIYRLILLTFVGEKPVGLECCHGPNGKLDDSLDNLSYGTHLKNCTDDKIRDGTILRGERSGVSRLKEEQVLEIKRLYKTGSYLMGQIAYRFNVNIGTVWAIVKGKTWTHT